MTEPQLPDAGYVYTGPSYWPHSEPWTPEPGKCRTMCSEDGHFWQCARRIAVEREVLWRGQPHTLGYCGQHDPVKVAERKAARDAKWQAQWDERERRDRERERNRQLREAALDAIRQIAAGHNDARGLAQEVLAIFEGETS